MKECIVGDEMMYIPVQNYEQEDVTHVPLELITSDMVSTF